MDEADECRPADGQRRFFLDAETGFGFTALLRLDAVLLFRVAALVRRADALLLRRALAEADERPRFPETDRMPTFDFDELQAARRPRTLRPADLRASARPRLTVHPDDAR